VAQRAVIATIGDAGLVGRDRCLDHPNAPAIEATVPAAPS